MYADNLCGIRESMSDLPKGWIESTLGDMGEWSSGGTPSRKNQEYFGGSIPWVKTGDLKDAYIESVDEYITNSGLKNSSAKVFPSGTLLLAMYGATIGRTGVLKIEAATNQACAALISEGVTADIIPFLWQFFIYKSEEFKSIGQGGAQQNISQTIIKEFPVFIPPLAEQHRIVAKLDSLLDRSRRARQDLERIPKLLDRYKQAILSAAFNGDLTSDWREGNAEIETASQLLKNVRESRINHLRKLKKNNLLLEEFTIQESEEILSEVPDTWEWSALGNYVDCSRGKFSIRPRNDPKYFTGKYPFIQIGDLPREGGYILNHKQTLNDDGLSVSRMFPRGTVAIAIVGATIGNTGILSYDMCFPDSLVGMQTYSEAGNLYVEYYSRYEKEKIRTISYAGGGQPNIKLETLNTYPLPLPPLQEQEEIVKRIEKLFEAIDLIAEQYQQAIKLLDRLDRSILAKAFRGELVPQDPNDEPATVLLERIQKDRSTQVKGKKLKSK
jgi:type I restriction enzyme, S subunit